jgi:hypothetical protein
MKQDPDTFPTGRSAIPKLEPPKATVRLIKPRIAPIDKKQHLPSWKKDFDTIQTTLGKR